MPQYPAPPTYGPQEPRRSRNILGRWQVQAAVLAVLLVVTLGLQWRETSDQVTRSFSPHEQVTVVKRGAIGELPGFKIAMIGREGTTTRSPIPGATSLALLLQITGDTKKLSTLKFQVRDPDGRIWSARPLSTSSAPGGRVKVTATVPATSANSVVLEAMPTRSTGTEKPVLRFAH